MPTRRDFISQVGAAGLLASCGGGAPMTPATPDAVPRRARGMVASSQRHASEAGASILRAGGNAADAAIATAAALAVTEPTATGIGGDCFALYYDARTRTVTGLNGSGRAPEALSIERLRAEGLREIPISHGHAITVPGACAGWCDLAARHGTKPLADLFAPAIALAEEGFEVAPITAHYWDRSADRLRSVHGGAQLLIDGVRAPRAGEPFRNPGMARTLRAVAAGGAEAFYRGEIAHAIVAAIAASGGAMGTGDLAAHASTFDAPITTRYRGLDVWECPPNGQGLTTLLALNVLSELDLRAHDALGPERMHLLVEALRLAFADTRWYLADPSMVHVPTAELLSRDYARRRAALIDPRARSAVERGDPVGHSETVYFCTVDRDGNACSFINSNYMGVGTGIVPDGWGFPLHNRGLGFSLAADHPNALAPRKRPYHTIIPGMLTRPDGSLYGPFGVMGGFMQPQGHVQVVVAMLDDGLSPQAALDRARFCIDPVDGHASQLLLEQGVPAATAERLAAMGHPTSPGIGGFDRSRFGRGQIIRAEGDVLAGGSDVRADGCVTEE